MAPLSPAHRHGCARLGIARLNAFRLNVYEAWAASAIDGLSPIMGPGTGLRIEGASVDQILNDQTDTAAFRVRGMVPVAGKTIQVQIGDWAPTNTLFAGRIIETSQVYEGVPGNVAHDIRCVDPTWLMNRRRVLAEYVSQSATAIVLDLIARFCRGVTTINVAAGLPVINRITFTNESLPICLTAVCERVGAHWFLDYFGDLHVFVNETITAYPITDATPRTSRNHRLTEDLSQVITKVIGRGGGGRAALDLPAGQTEIPVDSAVWYPDAGGLAEVGTMILTYTGVRGRAADTGAATAGSLVGSGTGPPPPVVWRNGFAGAALSVGAYQWAVTFVTATGETLPSPIAALTVSGAAPLPMTVSPPVRTVAGGSSGATVGGTYRYRIAVQFKAGAFAMGPPSPAIVADGKWWEIFVGSIAYAVGSSPYSAYYPGLGQTFEGPAAFTNIYRTTNGGSTYYLINQITGIANAPTQYVPADVNSFTDAQLVTQPTLPPAGTLNAAYLTDIPIGPTAAPAVTQRKIYRTVANGGQLKLAFTIANNVDTTQSDITTDAALGVNAPTADTAAINDNKSIPAGSATIPLASTAPFDADGGAAGGWARVGTVPIRYGGIAGGALTGVPATGVGALISPARWGAQVTVQPRLIGVTGQTLPILQGDTLTLRIEKTDAAAQAVMADRLKPTGGAAVLADGLIEDVLSDSRWTYVELQDAVTAFLLERKDPRLVLTFETRDPSVEVGRLITITTVHPPISGTFRIQRIHITEIAIGGLRTIPYPLRTVEASNKLYTFADFLRQLRGREGGVP